MKAKKIQKTVAMTMALAACTYAPNIWAQEGGGSNEDARQTFPQVETNSPLGVNLQTGRFIEQGGDLQIGPLTVDHYIRSRAGGGYSFSPFATSLHSNGGFSGNTGVFVSIGNLRIAFEILFDGSFFPLDSANTGWRMVEEGSQWVLANKSGDEYRFDLHPGHHPDNQGRLLTTMQSADGHKQTYNYDSTARLTKVVSSRGYAVVLEYPGDNVVACGINLAVNAAANTCDGVALKVIYGRDSLGRITSITRPDNSVIGIQYHPNDGITFARPVCVTFPDSSTCAVQNTYVEANGTPLSPDMVEEQTNAAGETWKYHYIPVENFAGDYNPYPGEIRNSYSFMIPPGRQLNGPGISTYIFGNGFLTNADGPGFRETYSYNSNDVYRVTTFNGSSIHYYSLYPSIARKTEGNQIFFTRDYADNIVRRLEVPKSGSNADSIEVLWDYPAANKWSRPSICDGPDVLCDKPTKVTAPNNQVTDFTYDPVHGGVLTSTGPADVNGVRPQTRYSYVQRTARDANGNAVGQPIWLLDSQAFCKTSAATDNGCEDGPGDEVVTRYNYGPNTGANNLNLIGTAVEADGEALRTCYGYDVLGRKVSETQPKGNISSCPMQSLAPISLPPASAGSGDGSGTSGGGSGSGGGSDGVPDIDCGGLPCQ